MFGYACDETPELMPLPISLAHRLAIQLAKVRHEKVLNYLLPDGKTQVSIDYKKGLPVSINTILISTQHNPEIDGITDEEEIRQRIKEDIWNHDVIPATEDLEIKLQKVTLAIQEVEEDVYKTEQEKQKIIGKLNDFKEAIISKGIELNIELEAA